MQTQSTRDHQANVRFRAGTRRDPAARLGIFLVAPSAIVLLLVLGYPTVHGILLSLYDYNFASFDPPTFAGLENYAALLQSQEFREAFWHTLYIVIVSLAAELCIGLVLALVFSKIFAGHRLLMGLILIPWMLTPVVAGLLWGQILNETYGLVNHLLLKTGLATESIPWLSNPWLALNVVTFVDVWRESPFVMIILIAGLRGINPALYEAAQLDGASKHKQFFRITLPLLLPSIMLALLLRTMIALQFFDLPWVMTRGGPAGATEVLTTAAYREGFMAFRLGYGASISVIILLLSLAVSLLYIKILRGSTNAH